LRNLLPAFVVEVFCGNPCCSANLVERRILEFEAEPLLPDRSGVTQPLLRMLAQETGERRAVALAPQHAASLRKPVTANRLDEMVPIEPAAMDDRQVIEWDEDDIEALGFMKVNVLGWACSVAVSVTVRFAVPCVYRKPKHGRSCDEVRPGWRVN
jgi:Bacterial DNA polymerase III alpha NTPase domain